jgi:hypothetical protein
MAVGEDKTVRRENDTGARPTSSAAAGGNSEPHDARPNPPNWPLSPPPNKHPEASDRPLPRQRMRQNDRHLFHRTGHRPPPLPPRIQEHSAQNMGRGAAKIRARLLSAYRTRALRKTFVGTAAAPTLPSLWRHQLAEDYGLPNFVASSCAARR